MPTITPAGHLDSLPRVQAVTPWGRTFAYVLRGRDAGVPESELPEDLAEPVPELLTHGILERFVREDGTPVLRAVRSSRPPIARAGGGKGA